MMCVNDAVPCALRSMALGHCHWPADCAQNDWRGLEQIGTYLICSQFTAMAGRPALYAEKIAHQGEGPHVSCLASSQASLPVVGGGVGRGSCVPLSSCYRIIRCIGIACSVRDSVCWEYACNRWCVCAAAGSRLPLPLPSPSMSPSPSLVVRRRSLPWELGPWSCSLNLKILLPRRERKCLMTLLRCV